MRKGVLTGALPDAFLGQLTFEDVLIDPAGQFSSPVQFSEGALDLRLRLNPFTIEIGQASLSQGAQRLSVKGRASAGDAGWTTAFDVEVNQVTVQRLMQLWPVHVVPKTREWASQNLLTGNLTQVRAALRTAPGAEPHLQLGYNFAETAIRFMAAMPPVTNAEGYTVILDNVQTVVLTHGLVTPPEGGTLDIAGSSMVVPDIYAKPARGDISLRAVGPAVAALSILDQKPFNYLTKAGRPVALGQGDANVTAEISLPLVYMIGPGDVQFHAKAEVAGFSSDILVEGRQIEVPVLKISAEPSGMRAGGAGTLDGVPFDATYILPFTTNDGPARVEGQVELSPRTVAAFDLGLPKGMVRDAGQGKVTILLPAGADPQLRLTSDLRGMTLAIPELAWSKAAKTKGQLQVEARLSTPPAVTRLEFSAPGLTADGTVGFKANGHLDLAKFGRVRMDGWLDGAVEIRGTNPLSFAVTSGSIDFRAFPASDKRHSSAATGGGAMPLSLRLDEFRVTDGIRLKRFRGDFKLGDAGVNGQFTADLGGEVPISGGVVPERHGTAVRVVGSDAGAAFRAAGLFASARGGDLDMTLIPRKGGNLYDGHATLSAIRVQNANVLAELLNAISVIGLLEQLNGAGIVFQKAEADFILSSDQVTVIRSSAVGASMGVSMEGVYYAQDGRLKMGGVISPIYLLNGIGAILTRKGEGLFGFTYRLSGTADDPSVGVNPLSILTPGMFREIFRATPPKLPEGDG